MSKENPASLRVPPAHYRTADLVIAIAFLLSGAVGGYIAVVQGVRDFWLLLFVGVVGGIMLLKRARTQNPAS